MLAIPDLTTSAGAPGAKRMGHCAPLFVKRNFAVLPYAEAGPLPNWESLATTSQYRLPALAQLCQVSLRTLQRHFRKHYNLTLSEWMRELRLDRARMML